MRNRDLAIFAVVHPGRCRQLSPRWLAARNISCSWLPELPMGRLIEEHAGCHVATSVLATGRRARVRWAASCTEEAPRCRGESRRAFVRPERVGFPHCARRLAALTPGSLRLESDQEVGGRPRSVDRLRSSESEMRHLVTPSGARHYSAVGLDAQVPNVDPRPQMDQDPPPFVTGSCRRVDLAPAAKWICLGPPLKRSSQWAFAPADAVVLVAPHADRRNVDVEARKDLHVQPALELAEYRLCATRARGSLSRHRYRPARARCRCVRPARRARCTGPRSSSV